LAIRAYSWLSVVLWGFEVGFCGGGLGGWGVGDMIYVGYIWGFSGLWVGCFGSTGLGGCGVGGVVVYRYPD